MKQPIDQYTLDLVISILDRKIAYYDSQAPDNNIVSTIFFGKSFALLDAEEDILKAAAQNDLDYLSEKE